MPTDLDRIRKECAQASEFKELLPRTNGTLDEDINQTVGSLVGKIPPWDPYQVDDILVDVSRLLDRCLAYRREVQDIDVLAIKQVLEFDLFKNQLETLRALEIEAPLKDQRDAEKEGQEAAANDFGAIAGSE